MNRLKLYVFWIIVLLVGLPHGIARAGILSNSDLFGQFNAIIFGNFATSSEVGGRTAVGAVHEWWRHYL